MLKGLLHFDLTHIPALSPFDLSPPALRISKVERIKVVALLDRSGITSRLAGVIPDITQPLLRSQTTAAKRKTAQDCSFIAV